MSASNEGPLRRIPSVDKLLHSESLTALTGIPHAVLVDAVRTALAETRKDLLSGTPADISRFVSATVAHGKSAGLPG